MCLIVSINAQGLRSIDRRQAAFNFIKRHKYDLILLQETHWTSDLHTLIQNEWDGEIIFNDGTDNSCGVAILIHQRLCCHAQQISRDAHGRTLRITLSLDDRTINLINIYSPSSDSERRLFYNELESFISSDHENIIGGDFNSITDPRLDKLGGNPAARQYATTVISTINARYNLSDVWRNRNKTVRQFTWTGKNTRDNSLIRTRIDKFLISKTLDPAVIKTNINPYPHSDHDLILLQLDLTKQSRGEGFWHFNNSLLSNAAFEAEIISFWNDWLTKKSSFPNRLVWWDKAKHTLNASP